MPGSLNYMHLLPCNGSSSQEWDFAPGGQLRSAQQPSLCLAGAAWWTWLNRPLIIPTACATLNASSGLPPAEQVESQPSQPARPSQAPRSPAVAAAALTAAAAQPQPQPSQPPQPSLQSARPSPTRQRVSFRAAVSSDGGSCGASRKPMGL